MSDSAAEVIEVLLPGGRALPCERYEAEVGLEVFKTSRVVGDACRACPNFDRSHSCPPVSPGFEEWSRGLTRASLIFLRLPVSEFRGDTPMERATAASYAAMGLLRRELLSRLDKGEGARVAGAGRCTGCAECSRIRGVDHCVKPADKLIALEAMGVNVVELVKEVFGIDLEWSQGDVETQMMGAVGAVFSGD